MSFRPGAGEEMGVAVTVNRPLLILFSYMAGLTRGLSGAGEGESPAHAILHDRSIFKARFPLTNLAAETGARRLGETFPQRIRAARASRCILSISDMCLPILRIREGDTLTTGQLASPAIFLAATQNIPGTIPGPSSSGPRTCGLPAWD